MKNKLKISMGLCLLGCAAMALPLGACAPEIKGSEVIPPGVDMTEPIFESERVVSASKPDITRGSEEETYKPAKKVTLHYHNDDNGCLTRRFYTWATGVDGVERKPDEATATDMTITLDFEDYPEYANMPSIFFIIKVVGTWNGQSEDTELSYSEFPPDDDGYLEIWTINGEGSKLELYDNEEDTKFPKIATAKFTDWKTIHCVLSDNVLPSTWTLYAYDKNHLQLSDDAQTQNKQYCIFKVNDPEVKSTEFDIKLNYTARINIQYVIESTFTYKGKTKIQKVTVSYENLFANDTNAIRFNQFYCYDGDDLGLTYKNGVATFKVWSPISARAVLNIYSKGEPKAFGGTDISYGYEMNYTKGGVWQVSVRADSQEDLLHKYYTFSLTNSLGTVETVDPYVKAVGINGMRGFVYDKDADEANPEGWGSVPTKWDKNGAYDISSPQDLSIYEVHIRDLTEHETWQSNKGNARGTFNAFVESGTTYTDPDSGTTVSTGFDHLTELGVKAVQLVPVFDHDDDERPDKMKFNWGYNPLNYNCVEGGYSSNAYDPLARIVEYKNLVKAFSQNENHTRVIMDVVYNHVSSASASCFTKTMPKYYFRYDENWNYQNGSGCNNEVKSEAKMMSKFIVDSLYWWAKEYKIKGFRFDLMGLIDWRTLKAAKEKLYTLDPDIYLYGEGWQSIEGYHGPNNEQNGPADSAHVYSCLYASSSSPSVVGGFNDEGRDATKGGNDGGYGTGNKYPGYGFIAQDASHVGDKGRKVANMMLGRRDLGWEPTQTVNYVSCHDNYTLYDQLRYTLGDANNRTSRHIPNPGSEPSVTSVVDASIACHAAVMMSNGVAFMQGGEELYRSKVIPHDEVEELNKGKTIAYLQTEAAQSDESLVLKPYPWFRSYDEASADNDHKGPKTTDILCTDEVIMYNGDIITHNSYKSSDKVNAFDWSRKISVDGVDVSWASAVWSQMIHERNNLTRQPLGSAQINIYGDYVGDGATGLAIWNGVNSSKGYSFFFGGDGGANIGTGSGFGDVNTVVFGVGGYHIDESSVYIGTRSFRCFRKGY